MTQDEEEIQQQINMGLSANKYLETGNLSNDHFNFTWAQEWTKSTWIYVAPKHLTGTIHAISSMDPESYDKCTTIIIDATKKDHKHEIREDCYTLLGSSLKVYAKVYAELYGELINLSDDRYSELCRLHS